MFAGLGYVQTKAPYGVIPGQPSQAPAPVAAPAPPSKALTNGDAKFAIQAEGAGAEPTTERSGSPPPIEPEAFKSALHEIARALVLREQQIEILINSLPGLGNSEADQERRIGELQAELREAEAQRATAEIEREEMIDALGDAIGTVRRVP